MIPFALEINSISSTAVVLFNPSVFLGSFPFFMYLFYYFLIHPKLSAQGKSVVSITTTELTFKRLIALKIVQNTAPDNILVAEALSITSGAKIPTYMSNVINCIPILPRFSSTPLFVQGFEINPDQNDNLRNWALFELSNRNDIVSLFNAMRLMSDPSNYGGSTTQLNLSIQCLDYFGFQIQFVQNQTLADGTPGQVFTTPLALNTAPWFLNSFELSFRYFSNIALTPQMFFAVCLLQPNFLNLKGVAATLFKNTSYSSGLMNGAYLVGIIQYVLDIPNPLDVLPHETESDKDSGSKEDITPPSKSTIKLTFTKIRKAKGAKVSKVSISGLKFSSVKTVSKEETDKFLNLVSISMISLEKASNILQVESNMLISSIASAWLKAQEKVDPDVS